jgi:predicted MFS family arabinose efflux permease
VAATGEGWAFFINAMTFVAVIIGLLLMRNLPAPIAPKEKTTVTRHMAEGIRFAMKQQTILVLVSLIAVSAFLSMPYNTLMPVYADTLLKESSQPVVNFLCHNEGHILQCQAPEALPLGILLTMVGVGAVIGALLVAALPDRSRRGLWLTAGNIFFPLWLILLAFSTSFLLSALLLALVGLSFVFQNALANTLLQMVTPDHMRGRVMSLYTLTFQATMRMGALQAGFMADWIGPQLALASGAVISLFYGVYIAVRFPKVRNLGQAE